MEKNIDISTFTYLGQDFDVLLHKNKLSYIMEVNGERYGNAVEIAGKSRKATVDAACNLLINLIDTYGAIKK